MKVFYLVLSEQLEMDPYEAEECMIETVEAIINGDPIDQVTEELTKENSQLWNLSISTSIWRIVSGLMLDLELPMLKGRCRKRYAEEQKISPWSVDMVEESEDVKNTKERRMSQFPEKIQEYMHVADNSGSEEAINRLLEYKKQNHVCSEEYICLLAEICLAFEKTKIAEDLIRELKKSSVSGKKEAKVLEAQLLQENQSNNKNEEEWLEEMIKMPLPYVRAEPKIGRNDPCPCGSGKKYKKCCGKNK